MFCISLNFIGVFVLRRNKFTNNIYKILTPIIKY